MPNDSAAIEERLYNFLVHWHQRNPSYANVTDTETWALRPRSVAEVSDDLLAHAEFVEIGLASAFRSPDGELIQRVVTRVLPYPYNYEAQLLVEAIELAADASRQGHRALAGVATIAAVTVCAAICISLLNGNG